MFTDQELENAAIALNKYEKLTDQELADAVKVLDSLSKAINRLHYTPYSLMVTHMRRMVNDFEGFISARQWRY